MDLLYGLLLILIGIGAGFVQRVSGFGLGIFAMIFLPHFMPSHTFAAAIASILACITAGHNAFCYRKKIKIKTVIPMICAGLISIPIAVHFSAVVSGKIFKILLGIVMIVLSLYFLFFNNRIKIKANVINGILAGGLGGTLAGMFSTGGPPAVLYVSNATHDNDSYFATIQFYFVFTTLYSTIMRTVNGIINIEILICAAIGLIGCFLGNMVGRRIFDKLDSNKLKRVIYIGMIISGIIMFF